MRTLKFSMSLAGVVVLAVGGVWGQTVDPAKVKVNGVGLDSTYAQVLKAMGKPLKDGKPKREECIGGREKTVTFRGAEFYLMDGDSRSGKTFEVKGFDVSSAKWAVSGLRVGETEAAVKAKFGTKFTVQPDEETGEIHWLYEMDMDTSPGWTTVSFKNGKVVSIASAYLVC